MRGFMLTIVAGAVLGHPGDAAAQSLDGREGGAAGLALAGAGVSALRTPAALWINPALLPLLTHHLMLGLGLQSDTRALRRTGTVNESVETRDTAGVALAPALALAHPLRPWLWAAVGYHLGLQSESHFPPQLTQGSGTRQAPGRYLGIDLELTQHVVSLGLAVRLGGPSHPAAPSTGGSSGFTPPGGSGDVAAPSTRRTLTLGAALELSHLRLVHRRALWAGLEADGRLLEDSRLDVDARFAGANTLGVGALLGGTLAVHRLLDVGLALRLPLTTSLRGELTLSPGTLAPQGYGKILGQGGSGQLDLRLPLELRGGVTVGPPRLRLLVEVAFARWSTVDDLALHLDGAALTLVRSTTLEPRALARLPLGLAFDDRVSAHLALELAVWPDRLVLRTGYAYHHGGTRPATPAPVLLELSRHVWGIGLEAANAGPLRFAVAFAQSFDATQAADGAAAPIVNPLDPTVTAAVGSGRYSASRLRVLFELGARW